MSQVGGFIFGASLFSASSSFFFAGSIREVWKPPDVFSSLACMAPAFSAASFSLLIAPCVPAQEKPLGKRTLAIWQTSSPFACSEQSFSRACCSRPATESIACGFDLAASAMAAPRTFTSSMPSSKVKTPAAHSAVYSPSERPAMTCARVTASSFSPLSFSTPAIPAMNMAGWQLAVSSSFDSGPSRQRFSTSNPRMLFAFVSMSFTAGRSFTPDIIFTYCDPWPGKSRPIGSGFSAGPAASAAEMAASPSSSGSASSPPYFFGSRPCCAAAPGLPMYHPFEGFLPCSQHP
mmetsp:Transcript_97440/g.303474  ORF Transcript_97440/g.303474 Transcript_97440/m.303474 type:complete len:291 (-) Transcript_97440:573-1445(-)